MLLRKSQGRHTCSKFSRIFQKLCMGNKHSSNPRCSRVNWAVTFCELVAGTPFDPAGAPSPQVGDRPLGCSRKDADGPATDDQSARPQNPWGVLGSHAAPGRPSVPCWAAGSFLSLAQCRSGPSESPKQLGLSLWASEVVSASTALARTCDVTLGRAPLTPVTLGRAPCTLAVSPSLS